jgi:hypothetical protein
VAWLIFSLLGSSARIAARSSSENEAQPAISFNWRPQPMQNPVWPETAHRDMHGESIFALVCINNRYHMIKSRTRDVRHYNHVNELKIASFRLSSTAKRGEMVYGH